MLSSMTNTAQPGAETPSEASHVRACTNCVRAKAKCASTSGTIAAGKCERCHRMNKICQPSPPVRRRRTLKPRKSEVEASKLEQKLDGLVTLLKSATQGAPGVALNTPLVNSVLDELVPRSNAGAHSSTATSGEATSRDSNGEYTQNRPSPDGSGIRTSNYTPTTSSTPKSSALHNPSLDSSPCLALSTEEAEHFLNRFRTHFIKRLPFIVIPPSITAHQLRQDRPILWATIMSVASINSTQQIALSMEIKVMIPTEAFINTTRNMDLLLAILVYITWDRRLCYSNEKPVMAALTQLAIAIAYDLGIDKPPVNDQAVMLASEIKGVGKPVNLSTIRTMEDRRALLGCFLMSSILSCDLRKGSTMRWTPYFDECLRIIETERELESDIVFAQWVKVRLVNERANESPWSSAISDGHDIKLTTPALFYLKSMEVQLRDFKSNTPPECENNKELLIEYHAAELSVYQVGLFQGSDIFCDQPHRRIECLWGCINAIKSWFNIFLSIEPAQYIGFSTFMYTKMSTFFMGLYRLATFQHPEWDSTLVRDHLDVPLFLTEAERNFRLAKDAVGFDLGGSEDMDHFTRMANKIAKIKTMWEVKTGLATISHEMPPNDEVYDFPMEFAEDDWLRDLIGTWND